MADDSQPAPTDPAAIAERLAGPPRPGPRLVGLELETSLLRMRDLRPPTYEEPGGVGELLARIAASDPRYQPEHEGPNLIALRRADGQGITLEPGGQLEVSSPPAKDLLELEERVLGEATHLTRLAAEQGLFLVGGGLAMAPQEAMPWMPKSRYRVMRAHFAALGPAGRMATVMMQRTLSVQVSLDWASRAEGEAMMRVAFLAAPAVTAAWACSPFDGPRESGFKSWRAEAWRFTDPARSADVPATNEPGSGFTDYARWALGVPLLFRKRDGVYEPAPPGSFGELARKGRWPDGTPVTAGDLSAHLSSLFPNARVKPGILELRSTDGQLPGDVLGVPALWVGLLYDPESRARAESLLQLDPASRARAHAEVPRLGLETRWGERSLLDVARELASLARAGLERRVEAGLERPGTPALLDPLSRRLERGRAPADDLLESWRGSGGDLRRLVEDALAFPCAALRVTAGS